MIRENRKLLTSGPLSLDYFVEIAKYMFLLDEQNFFYLIVQIYLIILTL